LHRRLVQFRHRTEDARLEIVDGLPANARVVARLENGLREGRAARAIEAMPK
jgi:HlyD family secretion protein